MKVCSRCRKEKDETCFNKNKSRKDGFSHYCKDCSRIIRAEEKCSSLKRYFVDVVRTSKQMYKKRGISDYELDADYLVELFKHQNGKCAISKIKMTHIAGKGKVITNCSIDRIDSEKGYTKDNVQLVCLGINMLKLDSDKDTFNAFLNELVQNLK